MISLKFFLKILFKFLEVNIKFEFLDILYILLFIISLFCLFKIEIR